MHRRSLLAALASTGALASLTACGGDDDSAGSGTTPSAGAPATGDGTFPVTVEHKLGSTTIESAPTRVVTVGYNEEDFVLALGVTPVGARTPLGSYDASQRPWAVDLLPAGGIPSVGQAELNFETIASLQPDLIVGAYAYLTQADYDKLTAIAPTIGDVIPAGEGADSTAAASWQEELAVIGRALGKSDEATSLTGDVESDFQDAVDAHPEFAGKTVSVVLYNQGYYQLDSADPRGDFFLQFGFEENPVASADGSLSEEQVVALDTDVLVVLGQSAQEFAANPVAAGLAVVTEGRTVYVPTFSSDFAGALGNSSPLSLPFAVEQAVPALTAAADGSASTVPGTL
ncbi:iron complex transport system substrate-binding protein [Kineococcus radiotolerans]|uniref:Iron complex transport system substrate-binding protein n=1 Tax=Kineococcus radiotolerans TaxID=131568 RepID=A0A7W4TLJ6_KINRA|nr:ABC transporter substrate-binding protein [Kineococcus radiotolerans]MBB2900536.1 iron complex transport system substrate-binding protein [Kineococcus radiotolerans]